MSWQTLLGMPEAVSKPHGEPSWTKTKDVRIWKSWWLVAGIANRMFGLIFALCRLYFCILLWLFLQAFEEHLQQLLSSLNLSLVADPCTILVLDHSVNLTNSLGEHIVDEEQRKLQGPIWSLLFNWSDQRQPHPSKSGPLIQQLMQYIVPAVVCWFQISYWTRHLHNYCNCIIRRFLIFKEVVFVYRVASPFSPCPALKGHRRFIRKHSIFRWQQCLLVAILCCPSHVFFSILIFKCLVSKLKLSYIPNIFLLQAYPREPASPSYS